MKRSKNPCYAAWVGKRGQASRFARTNWISGGAPPGDARVVARNVVVYALADLSADKATVAVTIDGKKQEKAIVIPADLPAGNPGCPKAAGEEEVKIGKKTYRCKVYRYETRSEAEVGRDCQGLAARVTVWMALGVPGGVGRRRIELTVKATYTIDETLLDPQAEARP
jgi:hypothetical protein